MTKRLISIDPGLSTGIVVGTYSDEEPFRLESFYQIEGGVEGFVRSVRTTTGYTLEDLFYEALHLPEFWSVSLHREEWVNCELGLDCSGDDDDHICDHAALETHATVIAEKFTARGGANGGFSYRTKDLEPLRVEGAMIAMKLDPEWCSPVQQYFAGGKSKAEKKKLSHRWLKEHGLYVAPKDVGTKDADDVRSATLHAIAYLRRKRHLPTIRHYFPEGTDD